MALFPKCTFQVLVPNGLVVPGTRVDGELVVDVPEPIPRAEHVYLRFLSTAWAGYGGGKSRTVLRRIMFDFPLSVAVNQDPLPAGRHRFPFVMDVPAWLPPNYRGNDCGIEHVIETRIDVDWALDPKATMTPIVVVPRREGTRRPVTMRSPVGFHESIVLEISLASAVISSDEPLVGQIALRSGHAATFDAVELRFLGSARIAMGRDDSRNDVEHLIRVPAAALRRGEAVAFTFPAGAHVLPAFRSSFIDYTINLSVSVDVPWAFDPAFEVALDVLPVSSPIHGAATGTEAILGGERLRRLAAVMAQGSGLREGRPPVLVEGRVGPAFLRIVDAPREARLGVDIDLEFPEVALGLAFRPLGLLDGFRESPLLPAPLAQRYLLRAAPEGADPALDDAALAAFVGAALADYVTFEEVRLSDHHLGAHLAIPNDEGERMVAIARAACTTAKRLVDAIARLPFRSTMAAARPAWLATAAEQSAFLVPNGPSLHGLVVRARVLGGEERAMGVTLRTAWKHGLPTTHADVDLASAPIPSGAFGQLAGESSSENLRAVLAIFPSAHVLSNGAGATLERAGAVDDPRALLPALEALLAWVLEVRGERRAALPYR